ncbi:MAG: hypothetical protein IT384_30555 [Deltaproteobacteria bacterium]|nr:hypothetical protein [Deltaproteobacteria bacterium]
MRIQSFRVWFNSALRQGAGAVRRAGLAVTSKVRAALGKIEVGGIEDDEDIARRRGSRAWLDAIEEAARRFKDLFDKSTFERLSRLENYFRRWVGLPPRSKKAPMIDALPEPKKIAPAAAFKPRPPADAEQAARMRAQIQQGMIQANTKGSAGLRATDEPSGRGAPANGDTRDDEPHS